MSDLEIQFYEDDKKIPANIKDICNDGTTIIEIPTTEGWICPRKNCTADYYHTHGTYESLTKSSTES